MKPTHEQWSPFKTYPVGSEWNPIKLSPSEYFMVKTILGIMDKKLAALPCVEQAGFIERSRAYIKTRFPWSFPGCHIVREREWGDAEWFLYNRCNVTQPSYEGCEKIVEAI